MECVAFISQKGGSAKTTSLISVSVAAARMERAGVLILDTDIAQGSALAWRGRRNAPWPVVEACRLADVDRRLRRARDEGFDLVFVDTAGRDDPALTGLIACSDFVAVPCRPTVLDRDAIAPNVWSCRRAGVAFGVLLTCVKANTEARVQQIRDYHRRSGGCVLDAQLSDRVRYQSAIASGLSVSEMSGDPELADEPKVAWRAIRRRLAQTAGA
ncbi:ParA family protein [Hansschlegelia beijingensis]|uniref:Chromosome partitioning protein n=1 Tax=Hansschlegelia beijingensis TaxID=1133344 RepID=A0A7W6D265_9HYPH|nr:ParA family protein [Hansschlegelia beijingensis]MBB3971833.1 chromosome partitioning protein [Hansschlegelia beijingensis]